MATCPPDQEFLETAGTLHVAKRWLQPLQGWGYGIEGPSAGTTARPVPLLIQDSSSRATVRAPSHCLAGRAAIGEHLCWQPAGLPGSPSTDESPRCVLTGRLGSLELGFWVLLARGKSC